MVLIEAPAAEASRVRAPVALTFRVSTVPVEVTGTYILQDTEHGSQMSLDTLCTARVPIIGGQIEHLLTNGLRTLFTKEGEFTADWIGSHR